MKMHDYVRTERLWWLDEFDELTCWISRNAEFNELDKLDEFDKIDGFIETDCRLFLC